MLTQQQLQQSFQNASDRENLPKVEIKLELDEKGIIKIGSCKGGIYDFRFELYPDNKYLLDDKPVDNHGALKTPAQLKEYLCQLVEDNNTTHAFYINNRLSAGDMRNLFDVSNLAISKKEIKGGLPPLNLHNNLNTTYNNQQSDQKQR